MKLLIILSFLVQCTTVFAVRKSLSIDVSLSPAGSFQIISKRIKGKAYIIGSEFFASNMRVPIKSLKTGVDLRDNHLQKKLGIKENSKAMLLLVSAKGKNGKGNALFKVLGREQTVPFTYEKTSKKLGKATFNISLAKFGIEGISYMGIGVEDIVKVSVICPYKVKK